MSDETILRHFGAAIQRVIGGGDLSRAECLELFRQILRDEQPDLQQGALLGALAAKGETPEEVAGAWQAVDELDTRHVELDGDEPLVENCGTGMDRLKTFNISSAAGVIAAAGGVRVARHGSRGLTSTCGTVDLLEAVGVNVECDVATVARSIRECGIGLFNGMSAAVHPRGLFRILAHIRFGSVLNIAASLASPCRPTCAVRGVHAPEAVRPVAEVMRAIGYRRAMVVHGFDRGEPAMDELSTLGETRVREIWPDGREEEYTLAPEDAGLERAAYAEIATTGDPGLEADRFLRLLAGTGSAACTGIACLNAGAVLYVAGRVGDLAAGVARSRELLQSGSAFATLCRWVQAQGGADGHALVRFRERARRLGLAHQVPL
jgi:anthranilate phosphoribosyltransferase